VTPVDFNIKGIKHIVMSASLLHVVLL